MSDDSATIVLKPEDDADTILGKVRTAGARQVNLVVPPGTRALQTLGGFTMLRKACDVTGVNVTIYSADVQTCDMAKVCRFDVVRLEPEARARDVPPAAPEEPRIVVSTRPPEPIGVAAPPEAEAPVSFEEMLGPTPEVEEVEVPEVGERAPEAEGEVTPGRRPSWSPDLGALRRAVAPLGAALASLAGSFAAVGRGLQGTLKRAPAPEAVEVPVALVPAKVPTSPWVKLRYYLWGLAGVVGLTVLLVAVYALSLPRTVVALTPAPAGTREMEIVLTVVLSDTVPAKGAEAGPKVEGDTLAILAKPIEVQLTAEASGTATGSALVPDGTAQGTVSFSNANLYDVYVPAGTRLLGPGGTVFVTLQDVTVPAAVQLWSNGLPAGIEYGKVLDVPIRAEQPGSAWNVDAGTITGFEAAPVSNLYVYNQQPTSGGSERPVTLVTEEDQTRLRETLLAQLREQAYEELHAKVGDLEVLSGTLDIRPVEESFSHSIGEEATTFTLRASVRATALASAPGVLDRALEQAVLMGLGGKKAGQEIGQVVHGAVVPVAPQPTGNAWSYRTRVQVTLVNRIDAGLQAEIRRALRGQPAAEAGRILQGYADRIAAYAISPVPSRLPVQISRIVVVDIAQLRH
ncbi:MAG: baseplate J/gp47 family protein [Chloroflexia bacterium]